MSSRTIYFLLSGLDELVKSVHRTSELTHLHPSFSQLSNWCALDYYAFLLTDIVVLFVNSSVLKNRNIYRLLVYLSNAVYYLHYGKQSDEIRGYAQKYLIKFARLYCDTYDVKYRIPKFHLFQHFIELVRLHGAACFWDSFNLERFLSFLNKCLTTSLNHMDQASMNFLTKRHCPDLQVRAIETYSKSTRTLFKHLGYEAECFAYLKCTSLDRRTFKGQPVPMQHVSEESEKHFKRFLGNSQSRMKLWQVKKMKFRNLALTSQIFRHREANRVRDCYVCLNEKYLGRIADMCQVGNAKLMHLLLLQVYKRAVAVNKDGFQILFPANNIPVLPTEEYMVFEMSDNLFVQKALWIENVRVGPKYYNFFALRANEVFEF